MIDMNEIIANNIAILRKQTDLAEVGGKQINLSVRTMNVGELRDIAKYLGTTWERYTLILQERLLISQISFQI